MPVKTYKTFPQYLDFILVFVGLFIPVPMSEGKYTPDFVINEWGFASTIAIRKIPLGLIMILIAIIVKII